VVKLRTPLRLRQRDSKSSTDMCSLPEACLLDESSRLAASRTANHAAQPGQAHHRGEDDQAAQTPWGRILDAKLFQMLHLTIYVY
jgi:hypothetical protein